MKSQKQRKMFLICVLIASFVLGILSGFVLSKKRSLKEGTITTTIIHQRKNDGDQSAENGFYLEIFTGTVINGSIQWDGAKPDVYGVISIADSGQYIWSIYNCTPDRYSYSERDWRYFLLEENNTWTELNWKDGVGFLDLGRGIPAFFSSEFHNMIGFNADGFLSTESPITISPGVYRVVTYVKPENLPSDGRPKKGEEWWCISFDFEFQ